MKFAVTLALIGVIGCFVTASPTKKEKKNGNVNAYVTDYYGNFITEKIFDAVDESSKYYAENYEKRIDQQDKIYVRANGKNLDREARLELTDSDGEGCSFDARVEWGNTQIDGFHVDTCDDQISITKGGSNDNTRSKRSAERKKSHKNKKGKKQKNKNVYPNIIAGKKNIKHALKSIEDLDLNFDVTIVREEYSFASGFDFYAVTEQVNAFFKRKSFGGKELNIRFTPEFKYKQEEKYSTNSSTDALEEFMNDVNTNDMYKYDGDVMSDAYVLISDDVRDKNVLAFVDSMGSDKNVAVVRNRGYQTADGIAKAIGHILGLHHPEDICKEFSNSTHFIMEKAAHWNSTKLPDWSECTRIISPWFLQKHKELLLDEIEFSNGEEYKIRKRAKPLKVWENNVCDLIAEQTINQDISIIRNYNKDPNICGVAYCDEYPDEPLIDGYLHHFTTYAIENERCAEQNLYKRAYCTNGKCVNRENGDEVTNGGWGSWELGNCTFVGNWRETHELEYDRCERKDTRKCNSPEPKNGGNECGYKVRDKEADRTVDCEPIYCAISFAAWLWDNRNSLEPNETMAGKIKETFPSWELTDAFVNVALRHIEAKDHFDIEEEIRRHT